MRRSRFDLAQVRKIRSVRSFSVRGFDCWPYGNNGRRLGLVRLIQIKAG